MNLIELKILNGHFDPTLRIAIDQDPLIPITGIKLDHLGLHLRAEPDQPVLNIHGLNRQTRELKGQPTLFYEGQRLYGFRHSQQWLLFK